LDAYLQATFRKLGYNYNIFVYALLDFDLFVSDLKLKFALPDKNAFNKFCEANPGKQTEICDEFYNAE